MAEQPNPQEFDPQALQGQQGPNELNASQLGGEMSNNYLQNQGQNQGMYPPEYDQQGNLMMVPQDGMYGGDPYEGGENYGGFMENFPIEALAPFNQGLASFANGEIENKNNKLKEARLMEALERQTSLLDSIAQSYQKNRDLRHKAELRKLKNRLERLENQKLFRDLEIQQMQAANDIAQQNNQLIFSHLNAQAQLRANPLIMSISPSTGNLPTPPSLNSLPTLGPPLTNSLPPVGRSGFPMPPMGFPPRGLPFGPGPGPMFGPGPGMGGIRPPFFGGPPPVGPRSGQMGMPPPFGSPYGKGHVKLPPIKSSKGRRGRTKRKDSDSSSSSDDDDSPKSKGGKKVDVDKYLNSAFSK